MTTTEQKCYVCHQLCKDGYACHECADKARQDLRGIAYLAEGLDDKRAKRRPNHPRDTGGRPRETPLPFDPRVAKVLDPIITAMLGTHGVIAEGRRGIDLDVDVFDLRSAALWTLGHVDWLRTTPEGPEEFESFSRVHSSLERLFDRPPEQLYLGECGASENGPACTEVLYVERANIPRFVVCRRCGAAAEVEDRRDYFQAAVQAYQATMRELAGLAPMLLDGGASRRTLHEWTRRGFLKAAGSRLELNLRDEWRKVPTYRIGDLQDARRDWEALLDDKRARRERLSA